MSIGDHPAPISWGRVGGGGRLGWPTWFSPPAALLTGLGGTALLGAVGAAAWLAIGSAAGPHWLELPTSSDPAWIQGPLHGLGARLGSLSGSGLSAALIALLASYLVALACSGWISLRVALGAIVLANLAFTLGPSILSTDVFGYIAYAREAARHGLNPYVSPPAALAHDGVLPFVYWRQEASPYGPLFTLLSVPLGFLSPAAALWSFKAAAGAASIAIASLVAGIARRRGLDAVRAALFVGLNPVLLFYAVSGAHNDLIAALLVLCAVGLLLRERAGSGAAAAVAAASVKVTLGLSLPFVLIIGRHRSRPLRGAALAVALAVALAGGLTLLLFGTHLFDQVHRITTGPRFDTRFSGPDRLATLFGTHITSGLRAGCAAAAALGAAVAIWRAWRGADPLAATGWAFVALLASIASLAPWYLVWLLPLAALGRSRALVWMTLLATVYLVGVHLPAFGGEPWISGPG